jgi:hypothetical protein
MEALIDLEQEAEFFAVIGQDEAAVALLSKHISATVRSAAAVLEAARDPSATR